MSEVTDGTAWYIDYNFALLRDYRVVKMADAQGNIRLGIFVPFIQNGIVWSPSDQRHIRQILKPIWQPREGNRLHKLVPVVTKFFRHRMVEEGVLANEDDFPCDKVGYVYRDKYK